jgi:signal transduction protein with GAF and PtsI domain
MFPSSAISRTQLARNTRQTIEQARRGQTILVESYGEEQVAIVDALDYRLLRAVAAYRARPDAPAQEAQAVPQGMSAADLAATPTDDPQIVWDRVTAAYLDGHISLGRAADLLKQSRFELQARFNRLGLPLRLGPLTVAEGEAEYAALMGDS